MSENLTLAEEEIVHENPVLELPIKTPLGHFILTILSCAALLSIPVLASLAG